MLELLNVLFFSLFWVAAVVVIFYCMLRFITSSTPDLAEMFLAGFLALGITAVSMLVVGVGGMAWAASSIRSGTTTAGIIQVTEIKVQSLSLPDGSTVQVLVSSTGWDCSNSTPPQEIRRVQLVSEITPNAITEDSKFYEVITKPRVSGIAFIPGVVRITSALPTGFTVRESPKCN